MVDGKRVVLLLALLTGGVLLAACGAPQVEPEALEATEIREYQGELKTFVRVQQPDGWEVLVALPEEFRAAASDELLANVDRLFGKRVAKLQFPL